MKRPSPRPPYKGLSYNQYDIWIQMVRTMEKLDLIDRHDVDKATMNVKVKSNACDSDWYKEQREQSMPWLQKGNKRKKFYP